MLVYKKAQKRANMQMYFMALSGEEKLSRLAID